MGKIGRVVQPNHQHKRWAWLSGVPRWECTENEVEVSLFIALLDCSSISDPGFSRALRASGWAVRQGAAGRRRWDGGPPSPRLPLAGVAATSAAFPKPLRFPGLSDPRVRFPSASPPSCPIPASGTGGPGSRRAARSPRRGAGPPWRRRGGSGVRHSRAARSAGSREATFAGPWGGRRSGRGPVPCRSRGGGVRRRNGLKIKAGSRAGERCD